MKNDFYFYDDNQTISSDLCQVSGEGFSKVSPNRVLSVYPEVLTVDWGQGTQTVHLPCPGKVHQQLGELGYNPLISLV